MKKQKDTPTGQPAKESVYVVSAKNKKIGIFLVAGPIMGLALIMTVYAVFSSIMISTDVTTVSSIISVVLGLLGLICIIGVMFGVPIGIVFLLKKELVNGVKYNDSSGKKGNLVIPDEIRGWNWGAAGLTWIWGIYHGVWFSLFMFIPLVNVVMIFLLGAKGNEWAWKASKWKSIEEFNASQKKWKPWGIVFFVVIMSMIVINMFG